MITLPKVLKKIARFIGYYLLCMTILWAFCSMATFLGNKGREQSHEKYESGRALILDEYPALVSFYTWPVELVSNLRIT